MANRAQIVDVAAWLEEQNLGQYAMVFAEQQIDGELLLSLTDGDLRELGLTALGHRKRLLLALDALRGDAPAPALPSAAAEDGERRQVTVLFADLAGYTRLTRELGSEEMHALTARFFAVTDEAVVSHGGRIDKRIGDCLMAVFGAPVAHSDDAERAVRAALAIRARMPELSRGVGRELAVHIGVASGQVVASTIGTDHHRQYSITGDSVNLAARLTSRAGDGEILLSGAVQDALADRLDAEPLTALEVKGFDQPVPAWRLVDLRAQSAARPTPFVGRRVEISHLTSALEACRSGGRGTCVYLRGEAGIGKSRLLEELRRHAEADGFACHAGTVLDFGAGAERDAIRTLARSLLGGEDREDCPERLLIDDLLGRSLTPAQRAMLDAMDHATRHQRRIAALAGLVGHVSRRQPLLLVIEDLHWANEVTLDYVARLCETVAECPALLVMTSRIENDPLGAAWRSRVAAGLVTIDLGPLRAEDAAALAGGLIDAASPLAQRCIERANGNPLFLEQLLRHAAEPSEADVPATVQSVVLARADKLPPRDRRALQVASVLGQRFALGALRHVLADPAYSPEALTEHWLVRSDGGDLVFNHALIRDGVYGSLLESSSRAYHCAAAVWYRERDLGVCAEHLDRGRDPGAAAAYAAAARAETAAYRPRAALALLARGQACAAARADAYALAVLEAEVLLDVAQVKESIAASGRALELADTSATRCAARLALAAGLRLVDRLDEAFAALELAERDALADELVEPLARIHHLRGNLYFPQARIDDCRAEHERALGWAEKAATPELAARALSGLGDVEYIRGRYRSARDRFAACLALCNEHGLGKIEVANRGMLAITCWFSGEDGLAQAEAAAEAARRVGQARAELIAQHGRLMALIGLQRLDEARASVERARSLARQLGAMRFEAENLWFLATIERQAGQRAAAAARLREAMALSRATSIGFFGSAILGGLALATEDPSERDAALAEAEKLLDAGSVSHNHFFFARDAIDAALASGEHDRALRYAARLRAYTAGEPLPWSDLVIARAESLVAAARGAGDGAMLTRLADTARALGQLDLVAALDAARASVRGDSPTLAAMPALSGRGAEVCAGGAQAPL